MSDLVTYAKAQVGTLEWKNGTNPKIKQMFADAGHPEVVDDDIAWCAAFVGSCLKNTGYGNTGSLAARSYLNFGERVAVNEIQPGDIVIWTRGGATWQGHVEIVAKKRGLFLDVIGGNVSNQVKMYSRKIDDKFLGAVRPIKLPTTPKITSAVNPTASVKVPVKSWIATVIAGLAALAATYLGFFK